MRTARLLILGLIANALQAPGAGTQPGVAGQAGQEATRATPVASNDNRRPAGRLRDGVLRVRLEARAGTWLPEGTGGLARTVAAFAEADGPLQTPGPLIRVPLGTRVLVSVRNALDRPLTLYGLAESRGVQADSFRVQPGDELELHFTAAAPGLYYYAGITEENPATSAETPVHPVFRRTGFDSQLTGLIVVDPPGAPTPARDRLFVIARWGASDSTSATGAAPGNTMVINGLSWPHTERFEVRQGDTLRWRWANLTALPHPMHLHGFYFRVDGRGDGVRDTVYEAGQRRLAVTETLQRGRTMSIAWSPERPGNWIFHCHIAPHMMPQVEVDEHGGLRSHGAHGGHAMSRLVLGIRVRPNGATVPASSPAERRVRLLVRSRPAPGAANVRFAYVLGGSAEESDPNALPVPGPTLVLERGRRVAITIVNRSHEPAAVHWHGIELESFPDGVPDWSGMGTALLRPIPAGDSLTVRFTPPRAGTFMYHSHFNELQQISSGLYGAIVVVEPGQGFDPETDHVLLFSDSGITLNGGAGPFAPPLLNGHARPEPMELRAGRTHRFRLVNIRSAFAVSVALLAGEQPVEWRHVAKDGAALPPQQAVVRPAQLAFSVGEIHDVEFTPGAPGDLVLRFGFPTGFRPTSVTVPGPVLVPVRVR